MDGAMVMEIEWPACYCIDVCTYRMIFFRFELCDRREHTRDVSEAIGVYWPWHGMPTRVFLPYYTRIYIQLKEICRGRELLIN